MNIVSISTSDIGHGAGISAFRLHKAIQEAGHNSTLLVAEKLSNEPNIVSVLPQPTSSFGKSADKARRFLERILNRIAPQNIFSYASFRLLNRPELSQADVIHAHNIHWHDNHFSPFLLQRLAHKKPLVWTLRDMWPLTGHCYYSYDCDRWRTGCGSCPDLSLYISLRLDTTACLVRIKRDIVKSCKRLVVVTPSTWLRSLALQSPIFFDADVRCIPNGIDTELFKPMVRETVRRRHGIGPARKVVLFASAELQDRRKGFSYFVEAMEKLLPDRHNLLLVVVGGGSLPSALTDHYETMQMGYITSEQTMSELYALADLYVMPSLQDNLPSVVLESLACGTPVVCFNTGGLPDMVKHLENGYLAELENTDDLVAGIKFVIDASPDEIKSQRGHAVETVPKNFTKELLQKRYLALYEELTTNDE